MVSKAICCSILQKSTPCFHATKKNRSNEELSRLPTKKLEVPESGSTLHQLRMMVASCWQKIESRYPRFGLQDIDCDLGCLIYATAASQWRIVEIHLSASVGWKQGCQPFSCRCSQNVTRSRNRLRNPGIQSLPAAWGSCEPHCGCIMPIPSLQLQKKGLSHAEKQRVWSRSCGLQEWLKFTYPFTDCAPMWQQAFSLRGLEVGLPAFQLPMFAKCDALPKGDLLDMFFYGIHCRLFWGVSKHPLSTRSLRLLRATVRSTSSALWLHHAHPFVATEEKHQSHAEKQRVLSRSCGLQDLLQYCDCALSCAMRLCECCKPMNNCRGWAFSKQWVGSGAASLSAADIRKMWGTAEKRFVGHVSLRNPLPPFFRGFPSIHSLLEA